MKVPPAQDELIHALLNRMIEGIDGHPNKLFLRGGVEELGISEEDGRFLRAFLQEEGLITNSDGPKQNGVSRLTAKGQSIARAPGGYLAHLQKQSDKKAQLQKDEHEQRELNRQSVTATVDSARSAKVSAKVAIWSLIVAGLSLVVAGIATYVALKSAAVPSDLNDRVRGLEADMRLVKKR